jgi:aminoglycoside phosphotransferase (APT) family kinase protein
VTTDADDDVARIAARHGLAGTPAPLPATGMINEAWRVGDHVVRINRTAEGRPETEREIATAPLVAAGGVRTPALVAGDTSGAFVPRAYTVYRRVEGVLLADHGGDPGALEATFHALGRELARIAAVDVAGIDPAGPIQPHPNGDARRSVQRAIDAGRIDPSEARELLPWLDELAAAVDRAPPPRSTFLHHDIHPWNVLVDPVTGELAAIIDWGNACTGDPALDFQVMPLQALPAMLGGYRDAGGPLDPGFVLRAVWTGIEIAGWEVRELDAAIFDRRWWRHPPGGWREHRALADRLLGA